MLSYLSNLVSSEPSSYVKQIFIHPVKSLGGVEVQESEVGDSGFKYDREYMVCEPDPKKPGDPKAYRFLTQREVPQFTLIVPEIDQAKNELVLHYPPKSAELRIPLETPNAVARDQNSRVNAHIWGWEQESINMGPHYPQIGEFFDLVRGTDNGQTTLVGASKRRAVDIGIPDGAVKRDDATSNFQDYFPGNLINEESLNDLRQRVEENTNGEVVLSPRNFRTNMVIADTKKAWDEDDWRRVKIGDYTWFVACRNVRCRVTTVNISKGEFEPSKEPLNTMMKFRRIDPGKKYSPCFGMNLVNDQSGIVVKVGDPVKVLERTDQHFYAKGLP